MRIYLITYMNKLRCRGFFITISLIKLTNASVLQAVVMTKSAPTLDILNIRFELCHFSLDIL